MFESPDAVRLSPVAAMSPVETLSAPGEEASVERLVDLILRQAIVDRASDVHFEPYEQLFRVRYRIDGVLRDLPSPPTALAIPVISRIKVMAELNIAECRVPQDGRMRMCVDGHDVDLRVSTLPTQTGESVVLRVLDKSATHLGLDELGMSNELVAKLREIVHRPSGMLITTGPTGSGKTTTLYSLLHELNTGGVKILTAEDPVEYEIDGTVQVPVLPGIGMTFPRALRAFLRQDPDIIMVGEIRDLETAQIAIQASLTGHRVLSTLHTSDSVGAIIRLLDLGVEPYLLAATLESVLAQRLVRRICPECRQSYQPIGEELAKLGMDSAMFTGVLYRGIGCQSCGQTGYQKRVGIFELLEMTETLCGLVTRQAPALELRQHACFHGIRTLRQDGLQAVLDGVTTCDEMCKCLASANC